MPVLTSERKKLKRSKIRYAEYYDLQKALDNLYADSAKGKIFTHLMELITCEENIKLAYRTIKGNTGSSTAGVDNRTIQDLSKMDERQYVALIQRQFKSYHPRPVRRVEIPKPNGKTRPLGIPTIVDRMVQQCVLQILEPICEAKFYDHSYGFRPNRSTEHAIARCNQLLQLSHFHYVVDIDIKGFFDNVNHTKLIQQIWHNAGTVGAYQGIPYQPAERGHRPGRYGGCADGHLQLADADIRGRHAGGFCGKPAG